jgi:hypothetical protein
MARRPLLRRQRAMGQLAQAQKTLKGEALGTPSYASFADPDTGQERMRVGEQDDGTFGTRVWDSDGNLVINATS